MNNTELIKLAGDVLRTEAASLSNIIPFIDEQFAELAIRLSETKKLIVSGVGKSGIIGRKIASTFASLGVPSFFMHPGDAMHGDLGMVQEGDICILLSKSGSTDEIVELLPYLKRRKVIIASITGKKDSYLGRNSDFVINSFVEAEGCPINTAPMASALVTLGIGDALAACVIKIRGITIDEFARQHPMGQIGRNATLQVADVMHKNTSIPKISSKSSFKEALICMTEKSLGCVCIVNENDYLEGLITDGDVRRVLQTDSDLSKLMCSDVMTSRPIVIEENIQLGEALSIMENRDKQIGVLPVVNRENCLVGVIRLHDIIQSGL
jgi:arabinose-5-phosphate isomerase